MIMQRSLLPAKIREHLANEKIETAFYLTAADLEHVLFMKLLFEGEIIPQKMKTWTLGKFIKEVFRRELIDEKEKPLLIKFRDLRNLLIHNRLIIHNVLRNAEEKKQLIELVNQICEFINNTPSKYHSSDSIEEFYGKHLEAIEAEKKRIFSIFLSF